jgi:hypothetical protein
VIHPLPSTQVIMRPRLGTRSSKVSSLRRTGFGTTRRINLWTDPSWLPLTIILSTSPSRDRLGTCPEIGSGTFTDVADERHARPARS